LKQLGFTRACNNRQTKKSESARARARETESFSKVSSLLSFLYKMIVELTFEKFGPVKDDVSWRAVDKNSQKSVLQSFKRKLVKRQLATQFPVQNDCRADFRKILAFDRHSQKSARLFFYIGN